MFNGNLSAILNYIVIINMLILFIVFGSNLINALLSYTSFVLKQYSSINAVLVYFSLALILFIAPIEPKMPI